MNTVTPSPVPAGLDSRGANEAPQHTRPDTKVTGVRTHRCEIRLTAAERRSLLERAAGQGISTWLRALALGQPLPIGRAPHRRRTVGRPSGSFAAQQQARALLSLAQVLGGLVDRLRPGSPRDQVADLLNRVRKEWEGHHNDHRDL